MKRRWYALLFLAALVGLSGQRADASRTPLTDVRASITQPHQLTAATAASDQPADVPNQVRDASTWIVESIIPLGTTADGQPLVLISLLVPLSSLDELAPASTRAGPYAAPETHTRVFCIVQPPLGLATRLVEKRNADGMLIGIGQEYYAPTGDPGTGYSLEAFDAIAGAESEGLWDDFDRRFQHVISRATRPYRFGDLSELELREAINRGYVKEIDWPLIAYRERTGDWAVGKTGREAITEVTVTAAASVYFGAVFGEFSSTVSSSSRFASGRTGGGANGLFGKIGRHPAGEYSTELRNLYLQQVDSQVFKLKLNIHNAIKKTFTFGRSRWITPNQIRSELLRNTSFKLGRSTIHRVNGGNFLIGGRTGYGSLNRATSHHEMLHIGQYLRNPNLIDTRPIGYIHELLPSYIGTPALYGAGTVGVGFGSWELYKAIR